MAELRTTDRHDGDLALTVRDAQGEEAPVGSGSPHAAPQSPARRRRLVALRRPVVVVLILGALACLALGVTAVLVVVQRDVSQVLVAPTAEEGADLRVEVSVIAVDPVLGEARVRLLPVVLDEQRVDGGLVREGFRILVNATGGETSHTFAPGQPVQAIEYSVALTGSSVYRYPFDRYDATLIVLASDGVGPDGEPLVAEVSVASSVLSFDLSAETVDEPLCSLGGCVALEAARPGSTVGYALWFIVLVWGLALAGAAVVAMIALRGVELPLWAYGYLVGVLFALPPLRASLPGSPPPGGLVDFVAFYWAVAVVGLTLLALVWLWVREARHPRT